MVSSFASASSLPSSSSLYSSYRPTTQETLPAFLAGSVSLKGGGDLLSRIAVQYHRRARA